MLLNVVSALKVYSFTYLLSAVLIIFLTSYIFFSVHSSSAHYNATVPTSSSLPSRPSFFFPLHIASPWTAGRDGASDDVRHPNSPLNLPPNKRTSSANYHNLVASYMELHFLQRLWVSSPSAHDYGIVMGILKRICHFSLLQKHNHFMTCRMQCTSVIIELMVHNNTFTESTGQWGCKISLLLSHSFVSDTNVYMHVASINRLFIWCKLHCEDLMIWTSSKEKN